MDQTSHPSIVFKYYLLHRFVVKFVHSNEAFVAKQSIYIRRACMYSNRQLIAVYCQIKCFNGNSDEYIRETRAVVDGRCLLHAAANSRDDR